MTEVMQQLLKPEKEYYTYEELESDCLELVKNLETKDYDYIVTMALGGLIPACIIGEILGNKNIVSLPTSYYEGEKRKDTLRVGGALNDSLPRNSSILLIDDMVDTGVTMQGVSEILQARDNEVTSMSIHYKPDFAEHFTPNYFARSTDKWVVYPWETLM